MLRLSLAIILFSGLTVKAQFVRPPFVPNPQAALDKLPKDLKDHLLACEKRTEGWKAYYCEFERETTNKIRNKTDKTTGTLRFKKPNQVYARFDCANRKDDFVAYICDGNSIFEYSGSDKVVKQHLMPTEAMRRQSTENIFGMIFTHWFFFMTDDPFLQFMIGNLTTNDLATQFELRLLKEDEHYVYIEMKPKRSLDKVRFETLIFVLFKANPKRPKQDYLLAKIRLSRDAGNQVEEWTFKQSMADPENIKDSDFQFLEPPHDWQKKLKPAKGDMAPR